MNTNPWSAVLVSLEEASIAMIGFGNPLLVLKKVDTPSGNVPVVGDGSDCFRHINLALLTNVFIYTPVCPPEFQREL